MSAGWPVLRMTWLLLVVLLSGCTALSPTHDNDDSRGLQAAIRGGEVLEPGDRVRVTLRDGTQQVIVVSSVDGDFVHATGEVGPVPAARIAIEDITRVELLSSGVDTGGEEFRNAVFLLGIGILMVIAAFVNF